VAAGLWLGGKVPVVMIQCTGFFEAGDAFRNVVHDLGLPLFVLVGVRSYYAHRQGTSADTCPVYTGPVVRAWGVPSVVFERDHTAADLAAEINKGRAEGRARVVLLAE
jgi:hypothetical protein